MEEQKKEKEAPPENARRAVYFDVRKVVRRIALTNPLLDIDKLLLLKRHDSVGVFHMCDQFYGCNARPGGGLYVLEDSTHVLSILLDRSSGATQIWTQLDMPSGGEYMHSDAIPGSDTNVTLSIQRTPS